MPSELLDIPKEYWIPLYFDPRKNKYLPPSIIESGLKCFDEQLVSMERAK
jgi:hypothetical protein